jgi:uncharacterized protein with GYD domain
MINGPGDRTVAVRQLAGSAGGSVESAYWMLGTHYGILIADIPDSVSAAALSIAVTSTGAFKNVQTHELLTRQQVSQTLQLPRIRRFTGHPASRDSDLPGPGHRPRTGRSAESPWPMPRRPADPFVPILPENYRVFSLPAPAWPGVRLARPDHSGTVSGRNCAADRPGRAGESPARA